MRVKLRDRRLAFVINGETIAGPAWSPDFKWLDLPDLANGMKTRKWFLLSFALFASAFALILALLLPVSYKAKLVILPALQTRIEASLGWGGGISNLLFEAPKKENAPADLYIGLLNSRVVVDAVIRRFDLQAVYGAQDVMGARENLAKRTEIKKAKDGSITISVEDRGRARAVSIANAYAETLQEFIKELLMVEASQRLSAYEAQLKEAKRDFLAAQLAVKQMGQSKGSRELLETEAKAEAEGFREENGQKHEGAIREMRYRQTLYEVCSKQYEEARLAKAELQNATVIRVVEAAVPSRKSSARIGLFVLSSALCGLLVGSLIVVVGRWKKWMKADPVRWAQLELLRQATADKDK